MSDYIKREDVLEVCEWYQHEYAECEAALDNLTNEMRRLHPADVVERKKGEWVETPLVTRGRYVDGVIFNCSECGKTATRYTISNYCPNCGADMRQKEET